MPKAGAGPALPVVLAVRGSSEPVSYRLAQGSCFVGSGKGAHLVVNDPTVSRQHCEVELRAGGVRVSDLDSRNGTFYLGQRVDAIELPLGASFSIGSTTLSVLPDADPRFTEPLPETRFGAMIGASVVMRTIFAIVSRIRTTKVAVLIEGEHGVGKGTLARVIHECSPVAQGPLVVLRCAAVPRDLLAAEVLGEGGSPGILERARSGTAYLADVDVLPLELQLAMVERYERERAGPTCARLITSSVRSLDELAQTGAFSSDLFFRCAVVRLELPPLRERREDIPLLACELARQQGALELPPLALEELKARHLPGNLRELESVIQAYIALGVLPAPARVRGSLLDLALEEIIDPARPYAELKDELVDRFTARYLREVLRQASGNQSVAARMAGMDRTYFGRLLAKLSPR